MTVLDHPRLDHPRLDSREQTPESQDLAKLTAMLEDPALVGFEWEIREAIERLREKAEA